MFKFFVFISRGKTTHIASFLSSDSCFSAAQIAKISLLILTAASLDNHLVLNARCNCRPFVLVVWCIARQADRNGERVRHSHNCNIFCKVFCSFVHRTVQICGGIVRGRSEAVPTTMHRYLTYNCRLQPSVAVATCRRTCFLQFVLLQYKAKLYLGFQNLGCHCKILGCHFDTQKRLKKHW